MCIFICPIFFHWSELISTYYVCSVHLNGTNNHNETYPGKDVYYLIMAHINVSKLDHANQWPHYRVSVIESVLWRFHKIRLLMEMETRQWHLGVTGNSCNKVTVATCWISQLVSNNMCACISMQRSKFQLLSPITVKGYRQTLFCGQICKFSARFWLQYWCVMTGSQGGCDQLFLFLMLV